MLGRSEQPPVAASSLQRSLYERWNEATPTATEAQG